MKNFYVFGNLQSKKVLIFEKFNIFLKFVKEIKNSYNFYSICICGSPLKEVLQYLNKFKDKKFFYFGDLDPTSISTYLKIKKKFDIKFCGITFEDYKKFFRKKNLKIKISEDEKRILENLKLKNVKELKQELDFLSKGYKIESEAISLIGFKKYFNWKIRLIL